MIQKLNRSVILIGRILMKIYIFIEKNKLCKKEFQFEFE